MAARGNGVFSVFTLWICGGAPQVAHIRRHPPSGESGNCVQTIRVSSAKRLYVRAGFTPIGEPEPLRPGAHLFVQPMQLVLTRDAACITVRQETK
jgi:hypothetical protein